METILKYNRPASAYNEALPVGNGRIGGMIFGGAADEVIKLNEDSIWSGGPRHRINPDAKESLEEIRGLIRSGNIAEAEKIAMEKMQGIPHDMRRYMPLGDLCINMELCGKPKYISRTLDLENAVADVRFTVGDTEYTREVFVSAPDEAMVIRITASESGSVSLACSLEGKDDNYDDNRPCGENMILLNGGTGGSGGISFAAVLGAKAVGGEICTVGRKITVKNADEVMIILTVRTSFYGDCYEESAEVDAEMALGCDYDELYYRHAADYKELFDRVSLDLCDNSGEDLSEMPTDERIERLRGNELDDKECVRNIHDNKLIELYFNYGRYLMISASRPNTQPMNLQGIWNQDTCPEWGSRYAVNINTQMNYWCAESCNLSECHLPLFSLLERICENGRTAAREMYGIDKGFVCHHNTDIWGDTAPQDSRISATVWQTGGAWLALHIFERYEYTLDIDFLREKYHIMKEAAEFFTVFLTENDKGQLVTCPSLSPENTYITADGAKGNLCMGPSMDSQIITALYNAVIKSAEALGGIDKELCEVLKAQLEKIPQPQIGKYGQIMEWAEDYDEAEIGHRHISQLFALHPADIITPNKTPKLADAARATLVRRLIHGGGHTGWSCAWIANMWARLYDSGMVYENIKRLLVKSTEPNMLNTHPPFQIDGNLGGTAAIAEALLQSTDGEIILLPALPDEWSEGSVCGLKAKGGFTVDITWEQGRLTGAEVYSECGSECRLRSGCVASVICDGETVGSRIESGVIIFNTNKGSRYTVKV